jgi:glycine oxidase
LTTEQQHSPDVLVVGAGVIGLAIACEARRHGLRAQVLDRDTPGSGASGVAAGMLAPVSEAAFGERELLELNLASARLYPSWIDELTEASGVIDPGYLRCGSLLVARDRDQAEALEREREFREGEGLRVTKLLPTAAREREPALAPSLRMALEAPDDHAVDPRALMEALSTAIGRAGGELRPRAEVTDLLGDGDRIDGVRLASGERILAGSVVVAAGCWSAGLARLPDEVRPPIRPVKGQLLALRDPDGPGLLRSVVRSEEAYLVPRGDGRYVLGATVEERGFDTTVTAGAAFDLLREAIQLVPGVAELEVEEARAGLRPGTPDNGPIIGASSIEGLVWATGHYRHGVLQAPLTAQAVVAELTGEQAPNVTAPFTPLRFNGRVAA